MSADDYIVTPSNECFVKTSVKKGILPLILDELLAARKRAKKDMAAATDPMVSKALSVPTPHQLLCAACPLRSFSRDSFMHSQQEKAVQNGRQLALKVSANSVYGFTGATVGQLPCIPIASSVTSYGRDLLYQTKGFVEKHYTIANGHPADAEVVYGDTDSVMVKFGVPTVEEAMPLAEKAADEVGRYVIIYLYAQTRHLTTLVFSFSCVSGDQDLPSPHQAGVRESLLSLFAHEQEALCRSALDPPRQV